MPLLAPLFATPRVTALVATLLAITGIAIWLIHRLRHARLVADQRLAEADRLNAQLTEQAVELEGQNAEAEAMASELEEANQRLAEQAEEARRAARRAERLHAVTGVLVAAASGPSVLQTVASQARQATEAAAALVVAADPDGVLSIAARDGFPADTPDSALELQAYAAPAARVLERGDALWLDSAAEVQRQFPELAAVAPPAGAWAVLPLRGSGRLLGVILLSFELPGEFSGEDRSFMLHLAQQCAQAIEREQLEEGRLRARIRAEFAERGLAFLADASARLSSSLDYETSLTALAGMAVPDLADWCIVHLHDDAGVPRLIAVAHTDPDRAAARRAIDDAYPGSGTAITAYQSVVETGDADVVTDVTDDMLRSVARDDDHFERLRGLRIRSQLTVPIPGDNGVLGALTLALDDSGREFADADVNLACELGRRAGQAVENARLYAAAYHSSEAKSDFLAVMSHELRTPLNAIIGYSDLLLLGVPNEVPANARRQVERIRSASDSLLHLVEEVLSFSRIEAGKEEIRISPVELSALLRDAVAMVMPMAAEKSLDLRLDLPEERLRLVSDERKIRQIVMNLLSNAVKFTEQGGIVLSATAEDSVIRVNVTDTGIGIPPEHLERVFDPFWQVEQASTRRFGGTGLGLGVARKLAKLLEGRLDVRSEVGAGSTFTLVLPRHTPGMGRPI